MKKFEVKSLFSKRLIPLLIVPALLGGNLSSIQTFANELGDSIGIESENNQSEESVSEEPVVEEVTEEPGDSEITEEANVEEQPEEGATEAASDESSEGTSEEQTTENQEKSESETTEEETNEESASEATSETEEPEDEEEAEDEEESDEEGSEKKSKKSKKTTEEEVTKEQVVVSVADFTFPVELVVEGAVEESKVGVYAVSEDGSQVQLTEGEAVDVKVDGAQVVTTETVVTTTVVTTEETSEEATEADSEEADEEEFSVQSVLESKTLAASDSEVKFDLLADDSENETDSDESTTSTSIDENAETEETVEIVAKENETPQVTFDFDYDENFYTVESVTLDGEEVEIVDGFITADFDLDTYADNKNLEAAILEVKVGVNQANQELSDKINGAVKEISVSGTKYTDNEETVYVSDSASVSVTFDAEKLGKEITITGARFYHNHSYWSGDKVNANKNVLKWQASDNGIYEISAIKVEYSYKEEVEGSTNNSFNGEVWLNIDNSLKNVVICQYKDVTISDESFSYSPKNQDDWYTDESKTLEITFKGKAPIRVTGAALSGLKGELTSLTCDKKNNSYEFEAKFEIKKTEAGKIDAANGTHKCAVTLTYLDKKTSKSSEYEVKIDTKAPETENIKLKVRESESKDWFDVLKEIIWGYKTYDVAVLVPTNCESKDESGLATVYATFNKKVFGIDDLLTEPDCWGIDEHTAKKKIGETQYYELVHKLSTQDKESAIYSKVSVKLTDRAGNESSVDRDCNIGVDRSEPTVEYLIDGTNTDCITGYKCDDGIERLFYKEPVKGVVRVKDDNLEPSGLIDEDGKINPGEKSTVAFSTKRITPEAQENVINFTLSEDKEVEKVSFDAKGNIYERYTRFDYLYTLDVYGEYVISTVAQDKAGNKTDEKNPAVSKIVVYDNIAPEIAISASCGETTGKDSKYTNDKSITITATVTEDYWLDMRIVDGEPMSALYVDITKEDGSTETVEVTEWTKKGNQYVATYNVPDDLDGSFEPRVVVHDIAGNEATRKVASDGFTADRKNPIVTVTFDNNDVRNTKYYNKQRTATITVEDFTFDAGKTELSLEEVRGKASESGWENPSKNVYTKQITFAQDGRYSFNFKSTDKAGNSTAADPVTEFVIDCTEPKITVSYTGGVARNEMYYKDARTATIQIDEMSFDANSVEYTAQAMDEAATLPALGAFTSEEDNNTAQVTFSVDGKYGYILNCTDLAGNSCQSYISDVFVIDTTVPTVTFSGVENYSANKGVVAPVVSYSDKYMDMNATSVKMVGSNNGEITLGSQTTQTEDGFVVSYTDFAHDKAVDDLYTFEATVVDLAGNETKGELVFSVNRFGSIFVLGDTTKALNEKYYTNEAQDIVITEINVDTLTYRDVSISKDGDITELKKDKNYTVAKQGSDTTWKTYTYTISKDNFKKDGVYSVTVYTEDRATNIQDNKSRDAEINFAIDSTKPSIVTAGIENGIEEYDVESYDFNLDVTDNMMLQSLVVYDNEEVIASYDQEQLLNNTDVKVITLKGSDLASTKRTIKIVAEDVAGNNETVVYSNVIVTNAKPEVAGVKRDDNKDDQNKDDNEDTNTSNLVVWIIVALGAVALAGGAGVVVYKKKTK